MLKPNLLFLCLFGLMPLAQAELWLPSIFSNGSVLQCDRPVPIWGEAEPTADVTVSFGSHSLTTQADPQGHWMVELPALKANSQGQTLAIKSKLEELKKYNIQIGEVWILAGQSNMGLPLRDCRGGQEASAKADYPWLHFYQQWPFQGAADEPAKDVTGGTWNSCTPKGALTSSGVGFYFARALQKALPQDTPIALINTQMGGTYIENWIDAKTLAKTPSAQAFLKKAHNEIIPGQDDPKGYWGEKNFRRPSGLYNGKVAPLQPFAVRGVLWYQGEGNSQKWLAPGYAESLETLIQSWRTQFKSPDLLFLVVQLPRYAAGEGHDWPSIRAAQAKVAHNMPGVELAVTLDGGEEKNIHPEEKEIVGERLALLARAYVHDQKCAARSPSYVSSSIDGNAVVVKLESSSALVFKGGQAQGFEICGKDQKYVPAKAEIKADGQLKIWSQAIEAPVAARYGIFNWGAVSLFDQTGLPAEPFSTEKQ
jgi:sialate O-acetylesterase